jgi:hypothetical protein
MLDGSGLALQFLPSMHVTAVASVVDDGATLVDGTDFAWSTQGWLQKLTCGAFSWKPRSVVVTLTHGYDEIPDDVQAVIDRLAARASSDAGALRQVGQVAYATTTAGVGVGGALTDFDKAQLRPYRIPST